MRIKDWTKNILIFTPLFFIFSSDIFTYTENNLIDIFFIFLQFSLITSLIYIFNDLVDINDDRNNPQKISRPFASGAISISEGLMISLLLLSLLFYLFCIFINLSFMILASLYILLNIFYSLILKKIKFVNIITMPFFYIIRVLIGYFALSLSFSSNFLTFIDFSLIPLASVKRIREIKNTTGNLVKKVRGYEVSDIFAISLLTSISISIAVVMSHLFFFHNLNFNEVAPNLILFLNSILLILFLLNPFISDYNHENTIDIILKDKSTIVYGFLYIFSSCILLNFYRL